MKYEKLKKRLLLESGILAGITAIFGIALFFLSDFSDDYQKDKDALESKSNAVAATITTIHSKFDEIKRTSPLYLEVVKIQSEDGFTINQQVAKNRFNQFRSQYYLSNLHLKMAPIQEIKGANYQRDSHIIISRDVSVDFEGLSDEYAYSLLNTLQDGLPGSSKITHITLTRTGDVSDNALRTISEKGAFPLIKGEIKFTWLGIKPVEPNDSPNASKPKP